jgi:hypothetical protein
MGEEESELESKFIILDFDPFEDSLEEDNESNVESDENHLLTTFIDDYEAPYGLNKKYK